MLKTIKFINASWIIYATKNMFQRKKKNYKNKKIFKQTCREVIVDDFSAIIDLTFFQLSASVFHLRLWNLVCQVKLSFFKRTIKWEYEFFFWFSVSYLITCIFCLNFCQLHMTFSSLSWPEQWLEWFVFMVLLCFCFLCVYLKLSYHIYIY